MENNQFGAISVESPDLDIIEDVELYIDKYFEDNVKKNSSFYSYKSLFKYFINYAKKNGKNKKEDWNSTLLTDYKKHLETLNLKTNTKNKILSATRNLLNLLIFFRRIPKIEISIKSFYNTRKHCVYGLTDQEINKVYEYICNLPVTTFSVRTKAIFTLMAYEGLTGTEITKLWGICIFKMKVFHILKKTKRNNYKLKKSERDKEIDNIIILNEKTIEAIEQYRIFLGRQLGLMFYSLGHGKKGNFTTRSIERDFKKIFILLGINNTVKGIRINFIQNAILKFGKDAAQVTRHIHSQSISVYNKEMRENHFL